MRLIRQTADQALFYEPTPCRPDLANQTIRKCNILSWASMKTASSLEQMPAIRTIALSLLFHEYSVFRTRKTKEQSGNVPDNLPDRVTSLVP